MTTTQTRVLPELIIGKHHSATLRGAPVRDRIMSKVVQDGQSGCWVFMGSRDECGYGRIWLDGRAHRPHRVMYEEDVAPIPAGLQIDHLCRNPPCVNPSHLEPVTTQENTARAIKGRKGMPQKETAGKLTHCPAGHPFSFENTYVSPIGRRICRACKRRRWAETDIEQRRKWSATWIETRRTRAADAKATRSAES